MVVSEECVLMSESPNSGSGLKRELGLVIPSPPPNVILEYSRKRFKKSLPPHQSPPADALHNHINPTPTLDASNHPIHDNPNPNPNDSDSNLVPSLGPETQISNAPTPTATPRRFTRSALTSTVVTDAKTSHLRPPRQTVVSLTTSTEVNQISGLHESSPHQPIDRSIASPTSALIKGDDQERNPFMERRSTLHPVNKETHKSTRLDIECEMQLATNDINKTHRSQDTQNELARQVETEYGSRIVTDDCDEQKYASASKSTRRFTRSSLQCTPQPMITKATIEPQNALDSDVAKLVVIDNEELKTKPCGRLLAHATSADLETEVVGHMAVDNKDDVQDTSSVKPLRRFTRATLKCMTEPQVKVEVRKPHKALLETPPRRFTRSALEYKENSGVMHENGGGQNTLPLAIYPVRTPHKKLEMKMSKKIALTKFPTTISELLETGMLEGLSVTYISQNQKNEGLRGLIKDSGILCSCTLCKGRKVVTSSEFKCHAGGSNRNFPCCLYLDNGTTFRHVLDVCKDAPLNMLEATIRKAIEPSSVKSADCLKCKQPLPVRRSVAFCKSCLELKKSEASSASSIHVGSSRLKTLRNPSKFDDPSKVTSPQNKNTGGKLTRKDLRLHKLVFEKDGLPDGTELGYYVCGKKLLEGYKKGFGIFCFCCNSEVSPSQFEAHAGWATRRKPYLHIYTSNGVSLHELSVSLSKGRELSAKDNDDLCGICADYGDLLLCDGCPRAFHKDCLGQLCIPRGKWYCPYCQNVHKDQSCANNVNALAAGRVSGVDPIEQISKRCIRIVKTPEIEIGGCTLCRIPGFSKSGFGPRTIILCDQCEKEFHVGCLKDYNMVDLQELPKGKWFCCRDCSRINCELQKCVIRGPEELPDSLTKLIKLKREESNSNIEISWRLLNGKVASPESRSLLSKAVAIFHSCFDPIVDAVTGRDLIPCMVYGRNIREQDFGGMFCAVLTLNSSVVSAGLLRIFGQEFAELPLVATSSDYQGQGYFQSLFSCIEMLLGYLEVRHLVLPAAEEAETIWTKKFGFHRLSDEQMTKYTKDHQMTIFRETPILHKLVPRCRRIPSGSS